MGDDYSFSSLLGGNSLGYSGTNNTSSILSGINGSNSYLQNPGGVTGSAAGGGGFDMSSLLSSAFGGKGADGSQSTGWATGGLGALQGLGNLYLGFQSYGLAKDQLAAQQAAYKTNLANQVSSYNTNLEDKIRGRTSNYDGKEADVQSYLASHKLST